MMGAQILRTAVNLSRSKIKVICVYFQWRSGSLFDSTMDFGPVGRILAIKMNDTAQ